MMVVRRTSELQNFSLTLHVAEHFGKKTSSNCGLRRINTSNVGFKPDDNEANYITKLRDLNSLKELD